MSEANIAGDWRLATGDWRLPGTGNERRPNGPSSRAATSRIENGDGRSGRSWLARIEPRKARRAQRPRWTREGRPHRRKGRSDSADTSDAWDRSSALTPPLATSRGLGNDELRTQGLPQVVEQENDEIPAVPSERSPRAERIREHPRNGCSKPRVRSCCSRHCAGQDAGVPVGRVHSERSVEARSPVIPSAAPQARRRGIAVLPVEHCHSERSEESQSSR